MSTLNAALSASASALTAERTRIEVSVSNIANADSTRGANGKPYRRRDVVLATDEQQRFDSALGQAGVAGVKVAAIVEDQSPFQRRYDPSHPDADSEGFVAMPNVDTPDVTFLRPSRGLSPVLYEELIGTVVTRDIALGAPFLGHDLPSVRSQRGVA